MDHFLYWFSTFRDKNEENLSTRSLKFWQKAPSNSVLISSSCISCICAAVSRKNVLKTQYRLLFASHCWSKFWTQNNFRQIPVKQCSNKVKVLFLTSLLYFSPGPGTDLERKSWSSKQSASRIFYYTFERGRKTKNNMWKSVIGCE